MEDQVLKNTAVRLVIFFIVIASHQVYADSKLSIYGTIHLSTDIIQTESGRDVLVSSNASRFGIKGSDELSPTLKVLWKLESEIDASGEDANNTQLKPRNRFIAIATPFGMLLGGHHDTPLKTLGSKVELFENSIADRRTIIGSSAFSTAPDSSNLGNVFDIRAKNALMIVMPSIAGVEIRYLRSTGQDSVNGSDFNSVESFSGVYKNKFFYVGGAYEDQPQKDSSAQRFVGGIEYKQLQLNFLYEIIDSTYQALERSAKGVSAAYTAGKNVVKAQAFQAGNFYKNKTSSGNLYAFGITRQSSNKLSIYTVATFLKNDSDAQFSLMGGEHGEHYNLGLGETAYGLSFGINYNF